MKKDDYLWDGSGEPDPEIERLESLLGRYRGQSQAPKIPLQPRSSFAPRLAIAAAVILMALAGLWVTLHQRGLRNSETQTAEQVEPGPRQDSPIPPKAPENEVTPEKGGPPPHRKPVSTTPRGALARDNRGRTAPRIGAAQPDLVALGSDSDGMQTDGSAVALFDFEVANHLERAQTVLRSFRNTSAADAGSAPDVSYERERARELLAKNILLRRDAEANGNNQVSRLLGNLEPILLDIANLPAVPAAEDVTAIRDRIQKTEMVATLQVQSAMLAAAAY